MVAKFRDKHEAPDGVLDNNRHIATSEIQTNKTIKEHSMKVKYTEFKWKF